MNSQVQSDIETNGLPASRPPASPSFIALHWKPMIKGSLLGSFDLQLPSGMILTSCQLLQSGSTRWVGLPGRSYIGVDGRETWAKVIEFSSKEIRDAFMARAIAAIDELVGQAAEAKR